MGNDISNAQNIESQLQSMKKYSCFSPGQVQIIKQKFDLIAGEDLTINKTQFKQLMKVSEEEVNRIFEFFDQDQSGKVDSDEFICGLALLSQSNLKTKAQLIFNLYDFDNNQTITFNELVILIKTTLTSLNTMSNKPEVTIQEAEALTNQIINKYDTNNDKSISLQEFQSFISKDPDILKLLLSYGLISKEDLRPDYGGNADVPETDSDLEDEQNKAKVDRDERIEMMKEGIEHAIIQQEQNVEYFEKLESYIKNMQWKKIIQHQVFQEKNKSLNLLPQASLEMEFVYGFRCYDTRNNIKYNLSNEVVYHTAAVGIVYDLKGNQRFYLDHTDDIICMDLNKNIVATGQIGINPLLCIWDSKTMETKVTFKGILKNGIGSVAISHDCKRVAAVSLEKNKCFVVYDMEKAINSRLNPSLKLQEDGLICQTTVFQPVVFDLKFDRTGKGLIAACLNEVLFMQIEGQQLKVNKGVWNQQNSPQASLCIGFIESSVITGMFKGQLLVWKNNKLNAQHPAHTGPVTAMHTRDQNQGIITGGKDGIIIVWDVNLKKIHRVDLKETKIFSSKITSVAEDSKSENVIVGTRSSEIVEVIKKAQTKIVMSGHWDGKLQGLAVHPKNQCIYTVGEDNLLAQWDLKKHQLVQSTKLQFPARCIDLSSNQKHLAIGCINGTVLIVDPKSLVVMFSFKDNNDSVTCIKFSLDCEYLVVSYGKPSCEIYAYSCKNTFKQMVKLKGSQYPITHIDFAKEKKIIQCCNEGFQLLYFDLVELNSHQKPGKQIRDKDFNLLKNIKWETNTCIYGYDIQGIWPPCTNGQDINTVDLSTKHNIFISGDDFSNIKLFQYPCDQNNASYIKYSGHSSNISKVRFAFEDQYVISTGGFDKTIIQWKFTNEPSKHDIGDIENQSQSFQEEKKEIEKFNNQSKQYEGQISNCVPQAYANTDLQKLNVIPYAQIQLSHVFGVKTKQNNEICKNVCKYGAGDKIVYATAGICVVSENNKQQYFMKHTSDIISLAIHPKGNIVATGSSSSNKKLCEIYIWEMESKNIISLINDFHINGVSHLEFSPDGTHLLTVGQDQNYSIAIYDWQQSRMVANQKTDIFKVTSIAWKSNIEFASCGLGHIKFWKIQGRNLSFKSGAEMNQFQQQTAIVYTVTGKCISGTSEGELFIWNENVFQNRIQTGHKKKINVIVAYGKNEKDETIYTGGDDGRIMKWKVETKQNSQEKPDLIVDLQPLTQYESNIISLSTDPKGEFLLFSTSGGEIFESKSSSKPSKLHSGHYGGELLACSVHPKLKLAVTSGADKSLRLWNLDNKSLVTINNNLKEQIRALDFAPNSGNFIVGRDIRGTLYIFNSSTLQEEDLRDTKGKQMGQQVLQKSQNQWNEDLKVSPDETMVAFGSNEGQCTLELQEIKGNKFGQKTVSFKEGFSQSIIHLDWSQDSQKLMVNSQFSELKFFSVQTTKEIPAAACKDENWFSYTCVYGWHSRGIIKDSDQVVSSARSTNNKLLVSGEANGIINMYQYPACVPKQLHSQYIGHTGRVTKLRFSHDDQYLVSIGGYDMSVMIWEVKNLNAVNQVEEQSHYDEDYGVEDIGLVQTKQLRVASEKFGKQKQVQKKAEDPDDIFGQEEAEKGDEFMAIKPWLGAIKEPSNYYKDPLNQSKEPPIQVQVEYVHGYRSKDCRDNIFYLNFGGIAYHAAGLGIVLDTQANTQRFFDLHNDDITAMAVHPDKIRVATGEIGPKPSIYVWNTTTLLHQCHFKGQLTKGISSLAFNPSGDKLVATAIDVDHHIAIFNINAKSKSGGVMLCINKSGPDQILSSRWKSDNEFACAGAKLFKVFSMNQSNQVQSQKGVWGKQQCSNLLIALNVFGDDYLCGAADGTLQVFKGNNLSQLKKLHDKPLDSIYVQNSQSQTSQYILTGGRDYKINILDKSYTQIVQINLEELLKKQPHLVSACPEVRALCFSQDCKNLIVGTYGSEIYELTTKDIKLNQSTQFGTVKNLIRGHYCPNKQQLNEVWGLATFPNNNDLFVTCSDDGTLRIWSVNQRKQEKMIRTNLDQNKNEIPMNSQNGDLQDNVKGKCVAVKHDGEYIVVGFKDGTVRLYDQSLNQVQCVKNAKEWVSDVKFSPDGTTIAAGSHDNAIYIHNVPDLKLKVKPLRKHSSYITHIDFSQDGNVLHSNCGAYELLFWNVNQAKQITAGATSLRNEVWATWTATLGWPVQGIWPEAADGTDINAVDRSNATFMGNTNPPDNYHLLATGDDFGKLKVFRYPCVQKGSQSIVGKGHSSFVTNVKFSNNDQYIFSTGGEDNCVFQWKIIYKNK